MKTKSKTFILLLILSSYICYSQEENELITLEQTEHLLPLDGILNSYDFYYEYYSNIRRTLFKGLSDSPRIQFVCTPSFENEYILHVQDSTIIYRRTNSNIWYSKNIDSITFTEFRSSINMESIELLQNLYRAAIKQTKHQIIEPKDYDNLLSINDGVTYIFTVYNMGNKSGQSKSPKEGTSIFNLVEISEELISKLKKSDGKNIKIKGSLKKKIENLTESFRI